MDGRPQLHLHKHGLLGSGVLTQGVHLSTYIVFPYMPVTTSSTQLTWAEQRFWLDEILLPALWEVCPSDEIQHCPLSALDAQCRARANAERVVKGRQQPIHLQVYLSEERLGPLWESIRRRIHEPIRRGRSPSSTPFQAYQDPILFVCGHGVKLLFKADTLAQARTGISAFLDSGFHSNQLHPDQVWLDLGLEDVPHTPANGEPGESRFSPWLPSDYNSLRKRPALSGPLWSRIIIWSRYPPPPPSPPLTDDPCLFNRLTDCLLYASGASV